MAEKKIPTSAGMETATETVNRVKGALANPSTTSTTTNGADTDTFMAELGNRLLGQSDVISSSASGIEDYFDKAIRGIESARDAGAQRIESAFGREAGYQMDEAQQNFRSFSEGRTGYATQMTAFRRLVETTDKNMNDLEQRKQELLLQGESEAASQIATMQIKALEFKQQAQQQVFSNLLGLGQFEQQKQQMSLAEKKFGLDLKQFDLSTQQFVLQKSNAAFERISQFQEMGALNSMSEADRAQLASEAGLPASAMKTLASLPNKQEIRAVGDTLLAIDPVTMKTTVLYKEPAKASESDMVDVGGGNKVSYVTSSVLNGLQRIDTLTATEQGKVRGELSRLGFSSENPPSWFVERMRGELVDRMQPGGVTTKENLEGASKATANAEWDKYRESILFGPRYLNKEFIQQLYPPEVIESDAEKFGYKNSEQYLTALQQQIDEQRRRGLTDSEIKDLLNI